MALTDRERFLQILEGLDSSNDIDKLVAANRVTEYLSETGLVWHDLIVSKFPEPRVIPEWKMQVELCLTAAELYTEWEVNFLRNILYYRLISVRQRAMIEGLFVKVAHRAAESSS